MLSKSTPFLRGQTKQELLLSNDLQIQDYVDFQRQLNQNEWKDLPTLTHRWKNINNLLS